jgi:hypothetical protein
MQAAVAPMTVHMGIEPPTKVQVLLGAVQKLP